MKDVIDVVYDGPKKGQSLDPITFNTLKDKTDQLNLPCKRQVSVRGVWSHFEMLLMHFDQDCSM